MRFASGSTAASSRRRQFHRRLTGIALALVTPVSLVAVSYVSVAAAPAAEAKPPNPTDSQIKAAAAAKAKVASDLGRLSGLIAAADTQIAHLDGLAELAKEKYLKALWELNVAKSKATSARAAVTRAQQSVDTARVRYRQFVVAAYINRGSDSSDLLVSSDPNALLVRGELTRYTSARQKSTISTLSLASVTKSNADAAARTAVANQATAADTAAGAQRAAVNAVATARTQRVGLESAKAGYEQQLTQAGMALTGLQNKRAAYLAWQDAERKRIAAEAARKAAQRAAELAAQKRELERQQQLQAQQNQDQNNGSGSGSSGGSGDSGGTSVIASGGWTPAKGQAAANRALQWLGEKYSFAAGNYDGPTWGACVTDDAGWNDCHVFGFDCSGLAMYAWAPAGIYMPHYAASQWSYGNVHPSLDQLMPGDLLFWSSDGSVPGIHHVAIYVGNGQIVQAPQSGDVVKISDIWMDEYYGATRPGS